MFSRSVFKLFQVMMLVTIIIVFCTCMAQPVFAANHVAPFKANADSGKSDAIRVYGLDTGIKGYADENMRGFFYYKGAIADYYYRSSGDGNWSDTSTWEQSADGSSWGPAEEAPNAESKGITITSGTTVTVDGTVAIDQTTVENGATLAISEAGVLVLDGDITINGDLSCLGTFNAAGNKVSFDRGLPQTLSGTITLGDTYISNELGVPAGSHLTFIAGSTVTFKTDETENGNYYDPAWPEDFTVGFLNVKGKLTAVGTEGSHITFTREGSTADYYWAGVALNGAGADSHLKYCDFSYAEGVINLEDDGLCGGPLMLYSSGATVENCSFSNFTIYGIVTDDASPNILNNELTDEVGGYATTIYCRNNSSPYIYGNTIFRAGEYGIYSFISSSKIVNNDIRYCSYSGIRNYGSESTNDQIIGNLIRHCGEGILTDRGPTVIYNNTIVKNTTGVKDGNAAQAELKNNILWGNDAEITKEAGGTFTVSYCCIEGGYASGTNIISDDPLFTNTFLYDYSLTSNSPCINAGTPDTTGMGLPTDDLAGNPRISGGRIDIGAYEFQQAQSKPAVTTQAATDLGATAATGNGNITDLGTSNPTAHGVCWSTSADPTVDLETKTDEGPTTTTGAFTSEITGLTPNTTYHYRAYATNDEGTGYGADTTFTTPEISYYYRVARDGDWSDTSIWQQSTDNTNWEAATEAPSSTCLGITITDGYFVAVNADVTIDQTTVESGAYLAVDADVTLTIANGDGTDLSISGAIDNSGTITGAAGSLISINSDNALAGDCKRGQSGYCRKCGRLFRHRPCGDRDPDRKFRHIHQRLGLQ